MVSRHEQRLEMVLRATVDRLSHVPQTVAIRKLVDQAEVLRGKIQRGILGLKAQHAMMLSVSQLTRAADDALQGWAPLEEEELDAIDRLGMSLDDDDELPESQHDINDELSLHADAQPLLRFELEHADLASLAVSVVAGEPVPMALGLFPENELVEVELVATTLNTAMVLLATQVGYGDDHALILFKPSGDFQSGQLLALAAEAEAARPADAPEEGSTDDASTDEASNDEASTDEASTDEVSTEAEVIIEESSTPDIDVSAVTEDSVTIHLSKLAAEEPDEALPRFGRYELIKRIASGGMATVYLGKVEAAGGFERRLAIKVMHDHIANDDAFRTMFLDEARLAARIHHPNVVSTLDVQQQGDVMFLVMEYISGPSLYQLLRTLRKRKEQMPVDVMLRILVDALAGLHAAHELKNADGDLLNLVHRDVSPHNVLVGKDGMARITDFGIARAEARLTSSKTKSLKGKLAYMAPEHGLGLDIDRRADLYALGIVMWEMLTGRRLFIADSEVGLMRLVLTGAETAPAEIEDSVPPALNDLCMRALAVDPDNRYQDAVEMVEALEEAAQQASVRIASTRRVASFLRAVAAGKPLASRVSAIEQLDNVAPEITQVPAVNGTPSVGTEIAVVTEHDTVPSPKRRRPWLAKTIGAVAILACAATLAWHWQRTPKGSWSTDGTVAASGSAATPQPAGDAKASASPSASVATSSAPTAPGAMRVSPMIARAGGVALSLPSTWYERTRNQWYMVLGPDQQNIVMQVMAAGPKFPGKYKPSDWKALAKNIGWEYASFSEATATQIGPHGWIATTSDGAGERYETGKKLAGRVVIVDVPGRSPILAMGAWTPGDTATADIFDQVVSTLVKCKPAPNTMSCAPAD